MPDVVKVTLNSQALIDISDSTVESSKVLTGYVGYEGDGDRFIGTYEGGGGGTTHTATISRSDGQSIPRAQVNGTGTTYRANGATFTWEDGDTIVFYLGASDYFGEVFVNDTIAYIANSGGYFTFHPPKLDIQLTFYRNTEQEESYIYITYNSQDVNVLSHNWDFTQSTTDTVGGMTATLTNCTQSSSGVYFDQSTSRITFPDKILKANTKYELDIASYNRQGTAHGRLVMVSSDQGFAYRSTGYWGAYRNGGGTQMGWQMTTISDPTYFDGHTLKMVVDKYGVTRFMRDNEGIMTVNGLLIDGSLTIGYNGQATYNLTITGMRIYDNIT